MMSDAENIVTGEVKKFIANDRGGWFLLWTDKGRFRGKRLFSTVNFRFAVNRDL